MILKVFLGRNSLEMAEVSSINKVSLVSVSFSTISGSLRDDS